MSATAKAEEARWDDADSAALIDRILARYHEVHRKELPMLASLAAKVERVHGDDPRAPLGLAGLLSHMEEELSEHMAKEEEILFPLMRRGGHPMIGHPIAVMRDEHDGHVAELARLTRDHSAPEGACGSWRRLCEGTRKLAEDLAEHMRLENAVLFPRFGG
ncbi:MAG: hemerythrin domain-containing protein [Acetobacteraceae bacterium]|nr:hemerythrin domain-containing protein [Acetobacteraceae bacterium]